MNWLTNMFVGVVWMFGALTVLIEAPSCSGFIGHVSRFQAALGWPMMIAANTARGVIGEQPRVLTCKDGQMGQWDLRK